MSQRILLYSHDTLGLGHLRRTLKLAHGLVAHQGTSALVVTGSACRFLLQSSPGLDFVKLPAALKVGPDDYRARTLAIDPPELVALRSRLIRAAAEAFRPHVLVIDNAPRGMLGEVEETLHLVRDGPRRCRTVLTMRDVLDAGATIRKSWRRDGVYEILDWAYDEVLVFGSADLFDPRREYRFPAPLAARTTFCGYLGPGEPVKARATRLLFTVGGGQDGSPLAAAFLDACRMLPEELRCPTLMVLGPDMPAADAEWLRASSEDISGLDVVEFVPDFAAQIAAAAAVVSMGGYNTLAEVVALGRRALIVPRVYPREEQLIRARLFAAMGLVDVLLPHEATAARLAERLRSMLLAPPRAAGVLPDAGRGLEFDGVARAVERIRTHAAAAASMAGHERRARHA